MQRDGSAFRVVRHIFALARDGKGRVGFHCPQCGKFYVEGCYTIENATHILGTLPRVRCCNTEHPTPRVFHDEDAARAFLNFLVITKEKIRGTLIPKNILIIAHFNGQLVDERREEAAQRLPH